jgi:hypothetical protein
VRVKCTLSTPVTSSLGRSYAVQHRKAAKSGFFRSFLSGEGFVAEFQGPGELLIQTRNLAAFAVCSSRSSRHRAEAADLVSGIKRRRFPDVRYWSSSWFQN